MHKQVSDIIVGVIKQENPDYFRDESLKDIAGNHIHVHEDTVVWETCEWLDYTLLDEINRQLEETDHQVVAEYASDYEVSVEPL